MPTNGSERNSGTPNSTSEVEYWDHRDETERLYHTEFDEAVEAALDDLLYGYTPDEWPTTITMYGYARETMSDQCVANLAERILEETVRTLDEDYELGDPEGDTYHTKCPKLKKISLAFARGVRRHYQVFRCEIVKEVDVNVMKWVKAHAPHWIEESKSVKGDKSG